MSSGDLKGGCGCMQDTLKEAVDVCRKLKRRLWMSPGDLKEGCGYLEET
jgi:hypothetical protein